MKKIYTLIAAAALWPSAFAGTNASGSSVTLYGNLIYDASLNGVAPTGIYSTDVAPSATVSKVSSSVTKANGGACLADTAYFAIEYTTKYGNINACYLNSYNPVTWKLTNKVEAPHSSVATSLTYNPSDKKIYGSFYSEEREKFYFGTLNTTTANCDTITFLDHSFNALASDAAGTMYFVNDEGDFGKISAADGSITIIGATGFKPKYLQDATFDYGTKQFYWCAFNDDDSQSGIYTVDLATGKATRVSTWATGGKEFVGVFSKTPVYAAGVPDIPASLTVDFTGASLSGKATFTMPSATYAGVAISGDLDYELLVDGRVCAAGKAAAGAVVTVDLSVERGEHAVSVLAKNEEGKGPEYVAKRYFGADVPAAVKTASATRADNGALIKWAAVTTGAHGAEFDASAVAYDVIRYPDSVAVATGVKGTECADNQSVPAMGLYYYEVVATAGDYKAAPAKTNSVVLGEALQVPYSKTFSDGDMSLYTIVDANSDGSTWGSDFRGARYTFSNTNAADDWLITPPLRMMANVKYTITAEFANAMDPYTEKAEVKIGRNSTPDAMTSSVIPATSVDGGYRSPIDMVGHFTPDADGDYFIGLHAVSDAGALYLYCYKLDVVSDNTGVVASVVNNAVVRAVDGCIMVTGAEGAKVLVASVDGRLVAQCASAAGEIRLPVQPGLYVVAVNGTSTKVVVK